MYLSTTQILKRLGIERNKKNADIVRKFFVNDFQTIGNVERVSENLYYEYEDNLRRCFVPISLPTPKPFNECQINSVTNFETTILEQNIRIKDLEIEHASLNFRVENQDKRILDLESEIALLQNDLSVATEKIEKIINVFRNFNKGE